MPCAAFALREVPAVLERRRVRKAAQVVGTVLGLIALAFMAIGGDAWVLKPDPCDYRSDNQAFSERLFDRVPEHTGDGIFRLRSFEGQIAMSVSPDMKQPPPCNPMVAPHHATW